MKRLNENAVLTNYYYVYPYYYANKGTTPRLSVPAYHKLETQRLKEAVISKLLESGIIKGKRGR